MVERCGFGESVKAHHSLSYLCWKEPSSMQPHRAAADAGQVGVGPVQQKIETSFEKDADLVSDLQRFFEVRGNPEYGETLGLAFSIRA